MDISSVCIYIRLCPIKMVPEVIANGLRGKRRLEILESLAGHGSNNRQHRCCPSVSHLA